LFIPPRNLEILLPPPLFLASCLMQISWGSRSRPSMAGDMRLLFSLRLPVLSAACLWGNKGCCCGCHSQSLTKINNNRSNSNNNMGLYANNTGRGLVELRVGIRRPRRNKWRQSNTAVGVGSTARTYFLLPLFTSYLLIYIPRCLLVFEYTKVHICVCHFLYAKERMLVTVRIRTLRQSVIQWTKAFYSQVLELRSFINKVLIIGSVYQNNWY